MRQVVQNYKSGELRLEEVPAPVCRSGGVVVRTAYSLVSAGTERMKVDQARMSFIAKARARPDKVRQVMQSVRQNGLLPTWQKVWERLDSLTPLGYSLAGTVVEVGGGIDEFAIGDRVACAGEGIACHAEFVAVPRNLCVHVPDGVELQDAAFATVGAIAMNGVRQAGVGLGDSVLVIGLGLVGLLGVQILKAAGCRVIGIDVDPHKIALAKACGADLAILRSDPGLEDHIRKTTGGAGPDAAYIAASTASRDPMELAGKVLRDRGRIAIVGMIRVEADWQTYYHKELTVVMSRSYGPGRYDRAYEQKGHEYPIGYVRWTERRNLEEFIRLVGTGQVSPRRLDPAIFSIDDAPNAYQQLHDSPGRHAVGMLFKYPADAQLSRKVVMPHSSARPSPVSGPVGIGLIGAGNFATGTLIPGLKLIRGVSLRAICSAGGLNARSAAGRHGFAACASDYREILADPSIHGVVIATRHDTHAHLAAEALRAGKHVFVEKPLALTPEQLDDVLAAQRDSGCILIAGYNRRFSPLSVAVRDHFASRSSPMEVLCRVNAGELKSDSWYQDADEGGWRILSEGCHFIDLVQFIVGHPPVEVFADRIGGTEPGRQNDNCVATIKLADGSLGTILYVANGDASFEKERIEAFGQGRAAAIENWRAARLSAQGRTRSISAGKGAKGHHAELEAFVKAVQTGDNGCLPVAATEAVTRTTFAILESLARSAPVRVSRGSPPEDALRLARQSAPAVEEINTAG